jgi:DNA-binding NtrC family response regulator
MTTTCAEEGTMTVPAKGVGLRILIAEDNAEGAVGMAMLLRRHGHDVEIAANGPTALEKAVLKRFQHCSTSKARTISVA